jgi:exodeoxyribonuclease V gamma subunit
MLHVHRSERADGLVAALRELLGDPLPDPFAREVVCVPTRGMERWLSQQLSAGLGARRGLRDGVCANVDFPSPRRLVTDAVAAATGIEPDTDPWRPERAVWPLLQIVDESQAELGPLTEHAAGPRRFAAVRHLADLFDAYALHRPEMLACWAGGHDSGWQAALPHAPRPRARACARTPRSSTSPLGSRCSASRGSPPAASRCCGRSPPIATFTCSCCTPRPRYGSGSAARNRSRAAAQTRPPRSPPTRCSPPGATTRASCSS